MSFGDYDPEDAWDAGDDRATHVHNLWERIVVLDDGSTLVAPDDLPAIQDRAHYYNSIRNTLPFLKRLHLAHLLEDIETVLDQ